MSRDSHFVLGFIIASALAMAAIIFTDKKQKTEVHVLYEVECVGLHDLYRKITGYDSVQMIFFMGKWEANFCYPNQWEFEKWKLIDSHGRIIIKNANTK